jgi:hypothetical protein
MESLKMLLQFRPRIIMPLCALAGAMILTFHRHQDVQEPLPVAPPPIATTAELIEHLKPLGFHAIQRPGSAAPEQGVLLVNDTFKPRQPLTGTWGDESAENMQAWNGIVQVRHLTGWHGDPYNELQPPGSRTWRWHNFVFFGDVEIMRKIRKTLKEYDSTTSN